MATPELKQDPIWHWYLTGEKGEGFEDQYIWMFRVERALLGLLPHGPRCLVCDMPFAGVGGTGLRLIGRRISSYSPKICNSCEVSVRKREGGAEIELTMLFADIRGSTLLADELGDSEFRQLIQRFYKTASKVLVRNNAMVNRLMGDQAIGLFVPRFAGKDHALVAIETALELLAATGHGREGSPWLPVGVGVHSGEAFVGVVGSHESVGEIAVLGNAPNLTARLSSAAEEGEVLVSLETAITSGLSLDEYDRKALDLKGFRDPVTAVSILNPL
jgi:adenylate cyclase